MTSARVVACSGGRWDRGYRHISPPWGWGAYVGGTPLGEWWCHDRSLDHLLDGLTGLAERVVADVRSGHLRAEEGFRVYLHARDTTGFRASPRFEADTLAGFVDGMERLVQQLERDILAHERERAKERAREEAALESTFADSAP